MSYTVAKVLNNPTLAIRNRVGDILLPGDVIHLYDEFHTKEFENRSITYYVVNENGDYLRQHNSTYGYKVGMIDSDCLELLKLYSCPADVKDVLDNQNPLKLMVRYTACQWYGKEYAINGYNLLTGEVNFIDGKNRYTLYTSCFSPVVSNKCVCNFFEREAYGCRCGRILG